jgi:hypothetical protein
MVQTTVYIRIIVTMLRWSHMALDLPCVRPLSASASHRPIKIDVTCLDSLLMRIGWLYSKTLCAVRTAELFQVTTECTATARHSSCIAELAPRPRARNHQLLSRRITRNRYKNKRFSTCVNHYNFFEERSSQVRQAPSRRSGLVFLSSSALNVNNIPS